MNVVTSAVIHVQGVTVLNEQQKDDVWKRTLEVILFVQADRSGLASKATNYQALLSCSAWKLGCLPASSHLGCVEIPKTLG